MKKSTTPPAPKSAQDFESALELIRQVSDLNKSMQNTIDTIWKRVVPPDYPQGPVKNTLTIPELAELQAKLDDMHDAVEKTSTMAGSLYDTVRVSILPLVMQEQDVEKIAVTGVGTVYLQDDIRIKRLLPQGVEEGSKDDALFDWLDAVGAGDVIKSTVNFSTLKAMIKRRIQSPDKLPKGQLPYPKELIEVTPFTRSQITGRAKAEASVQK